MKISTFFPVASYLIASAAAINKFWINMEVGFWAEGTKFTHSYPQCTRELHNAPLFRWRDDVSGDKIGVRMENNFLDPDLIEWNTGDDYFGHYTVYKERDYKIFDLDDKIVGQCVLDTTHSVNCNYGEFDFISDHSILNCTSDIIKLP